MRRLNLVITGGHPNSAPR